MSQGFDVRIGINPISWSNDDLPSLGGETPLDVALAEGAAIGYQGFELGNKFPREPKALRKRAGARTGWRCVSGWYSGRLARRSGRRRDRGRRAASSSCLREGGANVMVYGEVADSIQGARVPLYKRPRFARATQWREYGERMTRVRALHARARRAPRVSPSHGRVRRERRRTSTG